MYCATAGLTAPTGICSAGYFCGGGSSVATPFESANSSYLISYVGDTCVSILNTTKLNDLCPPGHYCPSGSASPVQCPPGTNSSSTGLESASECGSCPAGYYCPHYGTVYATLKCEAGYYCEKGTILPSLMCPVGSKCSGGDKVPESCAAGSYQDIVGSGSCKVTIQQYHKFKNSL